MKATGVVRRVDDLGRVVLPKEIRKILDIKKGDPLEIFVEDDRVIFQRYHTADSYKDQVESILDIKEKEKS